MRGSVYFAPFLQRAEWWNVALAILLHKILFLGYSQTLNGCCVCFVKDWQPNKDVFLSVTQ